MKKYIVEVRMWVKQVRPGGGSGEYEMTLEEVKKLVGPDMKSSDINVREV